jgi:predicted unusual protein kinase regulating ubiquinone biosynthesis (AarF/ABC1/UbiB family)
MAAAPVKAFGVEFGPMPAATESLVIAPDLVQPIPALPDPAGDMPAAEPSVKTRATSPDQAHRSRKLKRTRYLRVVSFFIGQFAIILTWEVILKRIVGNGIVKRGRDARTRNAARRFASLSADMGGVMIKLGQFLSSRVDILPAEITDELTGLQDNVPTVPFDYIKATVERELGPIATHYTWFDAEPLAAASFGQVHRAQLHTGERVVVKVQRPNISDIVYTDLSALSVVARVAMWWKLIRRRANVPALLDEFSRVLWEELDYQAEADHALTFASMFADDPGVYVPAIYLAHSTAYVLTIEDVTSIKLNDYAALDRAGINRKTVASRLLETYLQQIFDFKFFHADPHPGNIFIYPLPDKHLTPEQRAKKTDRPFYLIFIDFGMVGRLTPAIYEGLRETIIAVATQNANQLIGAYDKLGVLLPGVDKRRLEEATRAVFEKIWGLNMQEMQNLPYEEMVEVGKQFSDLLLTMPFQMPQDFIYLSRAVGILSGMCTGLDPEFDPWAEMQPFTSKLLSSSSDRTKGAVGAGSTAGALAGTALTVVRAYATRLFQLPTLAETVLTRAERGELNVQMTLDQNTRAQLTRIESASGQLVVGVVFATLALASTLLYINNQQSMGTAGYVMSGITLFLLLIRGRG